MNKVFSIIKDISICNSKVKAKSDLLDLFKVGLFSNKAMWNEFSLDNNIENLGENINSRLRNRMSQLSLGVYSVLDAGPGNAIKENDEICLFTGFGEIETTNQIIKSIIIDKYMLVSPILFHNSVHHTSLGYYTIIKKINNSCLTISDGLDTGYSFVDYIRKRAMLDKNLIVVSGEEYSSFHELDSIANKKIVPSFIAYKIEKSGNNGFSFNGALDNISDLEKITDFNKIDNLIVNKNLFFKLKGKVDKNIITEYPLVSDNPCGIIFRLSFPFIFNLKGKSLVLEEHKNKIYYFEVLI